VPFLPIFLRPKFQSQNITREKLRKALSYKKFVSKMLVKLTPVFHHELSLIPYFSLASGRRFFFPNHFLNLKI